MRIKSAPPRPSAAKEAGSGTGGQPVGGFGPHLGGQITGGLQSIFTGGMQTGGTTGLQGGVTGGIQMGGFGVSHLGGLGLQFTDGITQFDLTTGKQLKFGLTLQTGAGLVGLQL